MYKNNSKKNKYHKKNNVGKKWSVTFLILVVGVLLIFIFATAVGGYFYLAPNINPIFKNIYKKISLPVVSVDGDNVITSKQLFSDVAAVKKFYESKKYINSGQRVDFSTQEGKVRLRIKERDVLNKLIEDEIVKKMAMDRGISISSSDVDAAVKKSLLTADSDYNRLAINLQLNYGWTIEQFKNKIVKNQLYLNGLFQWYRANIKNGRDYKKAVKIKNKLSESGDNFDEMMTKFSDGKKELQNKNLPWMERSIIIPEVANVLDSMQENEISDVIISPLGMHIVMLKKIKITKGDSGVLKKEMQLKQIFIHGESFVDWIQKQKKQTEVRVLLQEYKWDKSSGDLKFSNDNMAKTAKKIKLKSQDDPSI